MKAIGIVSFNWSYFGFNSKKVHKLLSFDSMIIFVVLRQRLMVWVRGHLVVKWGPPPWCVPVLEPTHQKAFFPTPSPPPYSVGQNKNWSCLIPGGQGGGDGAQVTCWYHGQFNVQAAQARYLPESSERKRLHSAIADYFLGRNFFGKWDCSISDFSLYHYVVKHEDIDNKGIRQLGIQFFLINHQILKTKPL